MEYNNKLRLIAHIKYYIYICKNIKYMTTKEKIIEILNTNPDLSGREIAKILNLSRSTINKHIFQLKISRDRLTLQKLNNTKRDKPIVFSKNAYQLILGSILGDGSISKYCKPINSKLLLNSKLVIKHSLIQKDYASYKQLLFEQENIIMHQTIDENCKNPIINGRIINSHGEIIIVTQRNSSFNKFRNLFYQDVKAISEEIYKLTNLGLAIWFMDDGSKHKLSYYLHTECFSYEDHLILQDMLLKNFKINTSIHHNRGKYVLYISAKSKVTFTGIVKPFVCPSMLYKLHLGAE